MKLKVWDILNALPVLKKGDLVLIQTKILRSYNLTELNSSHPHEVGVLLSEYFLNDFCEKMYKVWILNRIIQIRHKDIQEKIE